MPLMILLADDDPGIRVFINDFLEFAGYSVITAEDGQAALDLLETYKPHLLITDIMMPRMDGYELVRQIRKRIAFRKLPVIFLTERASIEERIAGYQLGCNFYLPKPFDMQELGAMIRNLLERSLIDAIAEPPPALTPPTPPPPPLPINLTQREQEVLNLVTSGLSNAEIGQHLHLSPRTVEKHVSSLLKKTDTTKRAELLRFALKHHLVNF